jgi:hypothetical protein
MLPAAEPAPQQPPSQPAVNAQSRIQQPTAANLLARQLAERNRRLSRQQAINGYDIIPHASHFNRR